MRRRWDKKRRENLESARIDRQFEELAAQLGPLEDPRTGPRDYCLAEDETKFTPPTLPPTRVGKPLVVVALLCWLVVITVPVAFGLAQVAMGGYVKIGLAIFVVAALVFSFLSLPKRPGDDDDEGAVV